MKKFIVGICILLSLTVNAQTLTYTAPPAEKVLIADETQVVASGKTKFRVITSNDSIAHILMSKYESTILTRADYVKKKDRRGGYWERSFYFKVEDWPTVIDYIVKRTAKKR